MKRSLWFVILALLPVLVHAETKVETLLTGLDNPTAVAIQPETGTVFVSESGAGKVVRVVNGKPEDVVTGSAVEPFGKGLAFNIGPLGIGFQDRDTLVVADGGFKDGEEFVRVFTVPASGKPAVKFSVDEKTKTGPLAAKDNLKPEGNFYSLAVTKAAIYVTSNGDQGWLARALADGTKLSPLERFIATKPAVEVDSPTALAVDKAGNLVVGQMGTFDKPKDSVLTYYNAKTGSKLLNLETSLHDLTGLAFSPKTGLLYGVDLAWQKPNEGGLVRLDAELNAAGQSLKAVKLAPLDKPTSLAFAADGTLYLTTLGVGGGKAGSLLKIAPGL